MKMRVADYIAGFLVRQGIREVFMVTGGGMMFLSDGVYCNRRLKAICTHHEQAAAMAAQAYAKYSGKLATVMVTTGCGGTNTITGLLGAWQDSAPCLFISGQSKRKETVRNSGLGLRQFGVQEADIVGIVRPLTKYSVMVNDPQEIAYHLERAVYLARTGRPGPVWLDIPLDVQGAMIEARALRHFDHRKTAKAYKEAPSAKELRSFYAFLRRSKRPIVICGQGVRLSGAIQDLRRFCEKHSIPVVASRLGIDIFESSHPLFIGRIGNKGDRAGNFALQNADFIISIGSRLSVSSTGHEYDKFGREATLAAVDIDPVEHKKNTVRIDLFINADARRFLRSLKPGRLGDFSSWAGVCRRWKKMWPVCLPGYRQDKNGINLYYFVDKLSGKLKNDSVVVSDAGSAFYVASQGLQLKGAQRYITSGAQAEMGFTLPAAIGVCFARGKKEVIGITGDGSLQMNLQELQTVVYHKLPVKIFVWNNNGYLSIRATQAKFFGGRFIGTDKRSGVSFPDTAKLAVAYGISFYRVSASRQLSRVIGLVLREKRPVICEVICQSDQEIVPTVVSLRRSDGRLVSKPLEDMYPFLDRKTFHLEMLVRPLED